MQSVVIRNGNIFRPDGHFHAGDLYITNGVISDSESGIPKIIDAENLYIIPGLTDIHFHGCAGHDFCEGTPQAMRAIADYETSHGITTICPATMTLPEETLTAIMRAAKSFAKACPIFAGIYLEGPFISPAKIGAQNPAYIVRPSAEMLSRLQAESGGLIRIAVVAPEVDGGMQFIKEASKSVRVSLAHTICDYETAHEAFRMGARQMTHLYNAMNPINHRNPGPIIAAAENDSVSVELICDGVHVHPAVVRNTFRMFGADRIIFISDSMEATGMPDGDYELGGQKVIKKGKLALLEDGHTIAGSVTNLMDCMRTAVLEMNIPLEDAVKCAALNPAKAIGLDANITEGNRANLCALDKALNPVWVMNNGAIIAAS
ncbi:MAG: N-acetylglucosamine-6-phosphate deacetylase [Synergistaceae bacterium]|nr:N-acetylglucosamine-6-phosphate deacetylase [Synergistaceae bacterium]